MCYLDPLILAPATLGQYLGLQSSAAEGA